jgi:CRP-like cAMP-binding protein
LAANIECQQPPVDVVAWSEKKNAMNCACKLSRENRIIGLPDGLKPRFLSGLSKTELDAVISVAKHRRFRASSVLINEEDPAERLYLLTSGHGRHFMITKAGRNISLHWLTAGQVFGGAALLSTQLQYLANTEVLSDSCALVWERQTIREATVKFPMLLDNALSIAVMENVAWLTAAHVSLSADDAQRRVAHWLISLASAIGEATDDGVEMKILNEDLADGANVTTFTVSRCLKDWERAGILAKRRGKIVLRKPELLLISG